MQHVHGSRPSTTRPAGTPRRPVASACKQKACASKTVKCTTAAGVPLARSLSSVDSDVGLKAFECSAQATSHLEHCLGLGGLTIQDKIHTAAGRAQRAGMPVMRRAGRRWQRHAFHGAQSAPAATHRLKVIYPSSPSSRFKWCLHTSGRAGRAQVQVSAQRRQRPAHRSRPELPRLRS